jgi:hypothetical protein
MQSVPVTTNVASLNPAHGKVYLIQHYVIKFVSNLQQVGGFLWVLNKIDSHNKIAILLKVTLKHHNPNLLCYHMSHF